MHKTTTRAINGLREERNNAAERPIEGGARKV
jgi:hypothetical protein